MRTLLLLLALAPPPTKAALDTALLSDGEVGPECQLQSTEPSSAVGASLVPRADAQIEQIFDCGGDIGVVDLFDEGVHVERGVRELERSRWGGPTPPAHFHDALLRSGSVLADIFASRATTVILQAKLQAIGFASLAAAKPSQPRSAQPREAAAPEPSVGGPASTGAEVHWVSYEDGQREASSARKPLCLVFTATWCPHCRNYEKVFHDPRVVAKSKAFAMVKVDVDQEPDLAAKYAPDGHYVPRTFFLSPYGELAPDLVSREGRDKYVYDESAPSSILRGMGRALAKFSR